MQLMFVYNGTFNYHRFMTSLEDNGSFDHVPPAIFTIEDYLGESQVEYPLPEPLDKDYYKYATAPLSQEAEEILFQKSIAISLAIQNINEEIEAAFEAIGETEHPPGWTPF